MSLILLCPNCGVATTYHLPPVTTCSHCQETYPDPVRLPADIALRRSRAPKPALLFLGQICTAFSGSIFLLFSVLAPLNLGTYTLGDERVSGLEFFQRAGLLWGALTVSMLSISYGLWRERPWARPLMVAWWVNGALMALFPPWGSPTVGDAVSGIVQSLIGGTIAWWYLYKKENVVAYFDARSIPED
jgi:hypothetical protein